MKILDYQTLTPGHPAFDIWAIVYSATDAEYRALHLEEDLKAYYTVLSGFMEEQVDFKIFREEVENRRVKGMTMDGKFLYICRLINKCLSTSLTCLFSNNFFTFCLYLSLPSPVLPTHPQSDQTAKPSEGDEQILGGAFFYFFLTIFLHFLFYIFLTLAFQLHFLLEVCKQMLVAEDSPKDHPDIREMRRRVMSNINEFRELKDL